MAFSLCGAHGPPDREHLIESNGGDPSGRGPADLLASRAGIRWPTEQTETGAGRGMVSGLLAPECSRASTRMQVAPAVHVREVHAADLAEPLEPVAQCAAVDGEHRGRRVVVSVSLRRLHIRRVPGAQPSEVEEEDRSQEDCRQRNGAREQAGFPLAPLRLASLPRIAGMVRTSSVATGGAGPVREEEEILPYRRHLLAGPACHAALDVTSGASCGHLRSRGWPKRRVQSCGCRLRALRS